SQAPRRSSALCRTPSGVASACGDSAIPTAVSGMRREPPDADPHVRWCGGRRGEPGAYPILDWIAMSGHSKWSSIKHKKAATDAKKGKLFTKLARAIQVAAREGGADPAGNAALATAIDKAREASMPKDNIQRAIDKGSGSGADADAFETVA